jgi:uncharacterized protein (DUF1684 family)
LLAAPALAAACAAPAPPPPVDEVYVAEIAAWRADRETRLRGEDSWLTLVGLHWLETGVSTFGAAPESRVVLPPGSAPEHAGTFEYDGEQVTVVPADGVTITLGGEPIGRRALRDDGVADEAPDVLQVGRLSLGVIDRDGRHGIRVKDPESPVRTGFRGLDWFPIDPAWRVVARYVPRQQPEEVQVPNVLGTTSRQYVPGDVHFDLAGERLTLVPLVPDPADTHFLFIVQDATSGGATYGAGRYLYADLEGDQVVLDFNKAFNMPCVFTPYATCILPPPGNRLDVAIEAGEKMYGAQH